MKTKTKLFIAKVFLKILLFLGFKKKFIIKRNDIKWNLNISEGIDLSIFLFGSFQKDLTLSILDLIKRQKKIFSFFNIIDVGSNIGDKSLSLTKLLLNNEINNFKIFSIEPTEYAFNKQNENIKLNSKLKRKISNYKFFISSNSKKPSKIFSSWNLENNEKRHQVHGGILKLINRKTKVISLDKFIKKNKINHKVIIKIDVDGFELDVLNSLKKTLQKTNPIIYMEYAPYAFKDYGFSIFDFKKFLKKYDYKIYDLNFNRLKSIKISKGSSKDIILARDKSI